MEEDLYLPLSGIQHFCFCKRQWALIHLEQQWNENLRTAEGRLEHRRAHNDSLREKRGDILIVAGMRVISRRLRLSGICDMVEFHRDPAGVALQGQEGLWSPFPVEYKHGSSCVPRPWRWRKCSFAKCHRAPCSTPRPAAGSWWNSLQSSGKRPGLWRKR